MELKLVYRGLRSISNWVLGFYSEVYVDGGDNVPGSGPLIVVSCHHNEILDIATLAVTIPHRRPLCFWAKSSLFKNPLARAILLSSGSIPVHRNPNKDAPGVGDGSDPDRSHAAKQALFRETFRVLDASEVVGVFPEGTSYTEPQIAQVKEGAAWAALEYARWRRGPGQGARSESVGDGDSADSPLLVVPVGIVHTDKSHFQSRVCVRWGTPIDVTEYAERYLQDTGGVDAPREVVRDLTSEIERSMVALTINAPDWDTLHAARMARDILFGDSQNIPIQEFAEITQILVDAFSGHSSPQALVDTKRALLTYYSFLHYAAISHDSLSASLPTLYHNEIPSRVQATANVARQLSIAVFHPRLLIFLPALVLHLPAYLLGNLGKRLLANRHEEETHAQYKAIFGGLGAGVMYALVGGKVAQTLASPTLLDRLKQAAFGGRGLEAAVMDLLHRGASWLSGKGPLNRVAYGAFLLVVVYGTACFLAKWHNTMVGSNYRQLKHVFASIKILLGVFSHPSSDLPPEKLAHYSVPPRPPVNPFIKRRCPARTLPSDGAQDPTVRPPHADDPAEVNSIPASHKFIRPLFSARCEAVLALREYLGGLNDHERNNGEPPSGVVDSLLLQLNKRGACI
ncbi:uncharacterized protein FIBRA_01524 [Fibroporia radiculosa]|uniref:Phospholipid/glycerol acyltransferase domain-containing protein n=1 Tax=Fibroporia radiculosa TaxID=599839 RepID=J4I8J2_9APHY|nr:uncharacterized protein FIBRA_01524 [Fibroporia radiculosa]CCL99506.1 predicted protein [Fibroporia radiculosa]